MQKWYEKQAALLKRQWGQPPHVPVGEWWQWELKFDLELKPGLDINLAYLQLLHNQQYAWENGSKWFIQDELDKFPIINHVLKEGPYRAQAEDRFGGEDFHVVIQGDHDLIYFVPHQTGLSEGRYVDFLL